jgi:diguanylate cyclase (GGDEF)-like protein/PAS domain S-box-containing protein
VVLDSAEILIVDDDMLLRGMCASTLRHAGFKVREADSGEDCLAAFDQHSTMLVLLDVQMAGLDGFETCRVLRGMPGGSNVPVIMLTGQGDSHSIEKAYDAGATDFMVKPIQWVLLTQRVRYALKAAQLVETQQRVAENLSRAQRLARLGQWSIDFKGAMTCSDELAGIFGLSADKVRGITPAQFLEHVVLDDRERMQSVRAMLADEGKSYKETYTIERTDGSQRVLDEHAVVVNNTRGQPAFLEGVTQDVTAMVEADRKIRALSLYDSLTGLPNQKFQQKLVAAGLEQARAAGKKCAFVLLDVDRFKAINDALGAGSGDLVLQTLADRLSAASCSQVNEDSLARVGANSFGLFLTDVGTPEIAAVVAGRMLDVVAQPMTIDSRELKLSASAGISMFPKDADDSASLLRFAEQALYACKRSMPGQHVFFEKAINTEARTLLRREMELRHAIANDELRVYLQPKMDARRGVVVASEALVRWEHPQRGLIAPGDFIPLAESTGLVGAITDWMLERVCRLCVGWREAGFALLPVSINVSATCFMADRFVEQVETTLQRHSLAPSSIVLEVTESLFIRDVEAGIARVRALRDRGYRLSLDDFGTGYSSLAYLKLLQLDELKIDRSFVAGIEHGGKDQALVAAIVELARRFGMDVVAEGVESRAQAVALQALGCHTHQGYFYARPMPAAKFSQFQMDSQQMSFADQESA